MRCNQVHTVCSVVKCIGKIPDQSLIEFLCNNFQIASIFYYLCVVTLQYVAPILMCLYFALMYKTLGGYRWTDLFINATANTTNTIQSIKESAIPLHVIDNEFDTEENFEPLDKTILDSAKELQSSFHGLKAVNLFVHPICVFVEMTIIFHN